MSVWKANLLTNINISRRGIDATNENKSLSKTRHLVLRVKENVENQIKKQKNVTRLPLLKINYACRTMKLFPFYSLSFIQSFMVTRRG